MNLTRRVTVRTAAELQRHWSGPCNVLLDGDCVPFSYEPPPVADIVDRLRRDDDARLRDLSPERPDSPYYHDEDGFIDEFRALPLERVMEMPFGRPTSSSPTSRAAATCSPGCGRR